MRSASLGFRFGSPVSFSALSRFLFLARFSVLSVFIPPPGTNSSSATKLPLFASIKPPPKTFFHFENTPQSNGRGHNSTDLCPSMDVTLMQHSIYRREKPSCVERILGEGGWREVVDWNQHLLARDGHNSKRSDNQSETKALNLFCQTIACLDKHQNLCVRRINQHPHKPYLLACQRLLWLQYAFLCFLLFTFAADIHLLPRDRHCSQRKCPQK